MIEYALTKNKHKVISSKTLLSNISIVLLCLLMFWSMYPWFFWYQRGLILNSLVILFIFSRIFFSQGKVVSHQLGIILWGFLLFSEMLFSELSFSIVLRNMYSLLVLFFVVTMRDDEKIKIVKLITNLYAWIVGISLFCYILVVFGGFNLPYSLIKLPDNDYYGYFENYVFFLLPNEFRPFDRFQSIFVESGHLGMISALLLYLNNYELRKKEVFVIFLSVLFSFSLAAYVLLALGYFIREIILILKKKIYVKILKLTLGLALIVMAGMYIYDNYVDSMVSQLIISRLELDENKGIVGNNRTSTLFDFYYDNNFRKSNALIFGIGPQQVQEAKLLGSVSNSGTSSYKVFILQYGIAGIILLFIFYLSMVYYARSEWLLGLFVLYCASFWQRPYALWEMELYLFIAAMALCNNKNTKIR